ncbi:MAG: cytochrome C [Myxococcota bacterium]|jgi:mono/diheme cytochrome c family protein
MRAFALMLGAIGGLAAFASRAEPVATRSPRVNYMVNCQGCHLPDGRGLPGKVPAMQGFLASFLEVPGGREYLARVPGVANSTLGDADLAALMNWLILEMGPAVSVDFTPYSAQEIGALRKDRLQDVNSARAMLVAQMPAGSLSARQPGKR